MRSCTHKWLPSKPCLYHVHRRNPIITHATVAARIRAVPEVNILTGKIHYKNVIDLSSPQRPQYPAMSILFRHLEKSIQSSEDQQVVTSLINERLDRFFRQHPSSAHVSDTILRFLLNRSCIPAAIALHDCLATEAIHIAPSIKALMLLTSSFTTRKVQATELPTSIKRIIEAETFTFTELMKLSRGMKRLDVPSEMLLKTMVIFLKSHPSPWPVKLYPGICKQVMDLARREGNIEHILDALSVLPRHDVGNVILSEAYASFLAAKLNKTVVFGAKNHIPQEDIATDLSDRPVPRASRVRTRTVVHPLSTRRTRNSKLVPVYRNFDSLLKAFNSSYNSYARPRPGYPRGEILPPNISNPRALYHEIFKDPPQFQLTTSLFNKMLHSFVYSRDYTGAYFMAKAFRTCDVPVNIQTYLIVICHLISRILHGIRATNKMGSDIWTVRFLRLPLPSGDPTAVAIAQGSDELARHMLSVSKRHRFKYPDALNGIDPEFYLTPTVEAMLGRERINLNESFDAVPLQRLLQKALFAERHSVQEYGAAHRYMWRGIEKFMEKIVDGVPYNP